MSTLNIMNSDDRLSYRVEWDVHYITDEQIDTIRTCIESLQAENEKLQELVKNMYACIETLCSMVENSPGCSMCPTNQDEEKPCAAADAYCRMRELGVEV